MSSVFLRERLSVGRHTLKGVEMPQDAAESGKTERELLEEATRLRDTLKNLLQRVSELIEKTRAEINKHSPHAK